MRLPFFWLWIGIGLGASSLAQAGPQYRVEVLPPTPINGKIPTNLAAGAINDAGVVVGTLTSDSVYRYANGSFEYLAQVGSGKDTNNHGTILWDRAGMPNKPAGLIYPDGTTRSLTLPTGLPNNTYKLRLRHMTESGYVAGSLSTGDAADPSFGAIFDPAGNRIVLASNFVYTMLWNVKEDGRVFGSYGAGHIGDYNTMGNNTAFSWKDGVPTFYGSGAAQIGTEDGSVYGTYREQAGEDYAFVWRNGVRTDLTDTSGHRFTDSRIDLLASNTAGIVVGSSYSQAIGLFDDKVLKLKDLVSGGFGDVLNLNTAVDINSQGWILCNAKIKNGTGTRIGPVILKPVPEPATWLALGAGLAVLVKRRR